MSGEAILSEAMTEADLDAVSALEASLQVHPWARGNFADSLAAGHAARVLRSAGEVIGFSVVMTVLDEAHLLNLGVDRCHQGQGHGARLLQQVIEEARSAGARRLLLEVRSSNRQAIDFYQRFAFTQVGVRRAYYPTLAGREDALLFDKELQ